MAFHLLQEAQSLVVRRGLADRPVAEAQTCRLYEKEEVFLVQQPEDPLEHRGSCTEEEDMKDWVACEIITLGQVEI